MLDFRVDYDELASAYQRLQQQAEEAQSAIAECNGCLDNLQGGRMWIGNGANAFYSEMESSILPSMQRLLDALTLGHELVKASHDIIQQAEDDARLVFERWTA